MRVMLEITFKYKSDTTQDYRTRYTLKDMENDDAMRDFQTAFKNFLAEYRATGDYVTAEEIANRLYVSRSAVYKWTKNGMPTHRLPKWKGANRYLWDEIIPWLEINRPGYVSILEGE